MKQHYSETKSQTRNIAGDPFAKSNSRFQNEALSRKAVQFKQRSSIQKQNEDHQALTTRFIVPDGIAPHQGQISREAFLAALHHKVSVRANGILSKVGESSADCPYIAYWFSYYATKDAAHIEESIGRYAPETNSAKDWESYTDVLVGHVTTSFSSYVSTGEVVGVPSDIPKDLHEKPKSQKGVIQKKDVAQMCDCDTTDDDSEDSIFSKLPNEDIQHIIGNGDALGGNLKSIKKVTGSKNYIVASDAVKDDSSGLEKEVGLLMELRKQGLDVPNIYTHPDLASDAHTGVSKVKGKPAFIADYVDGEMIDIWKIEGKIKGGIRAYFQKAPKENIHNIAAKVKSGFGTIANYLTNNIIIDLQAILENGTGRVVVIDPLAIYPVKDIQDDEKLENHHRVTKEIADGVQYVDTCVHQILNGPNEEALSKQELVELYETCEMDNVTFHSKLVNLLMQLSIPANNINLRKYMEISDCLTEEEIKELLKEE